MCSYLFVPQRRTGSVHALWIMDVSRRFMSIGCGEELLQLKTLKLACDKSELKDEDNRQVVIG